MSFPEGSGEARTKWPWNWETLSHADRDTLVAFHAARTGRHEAFDWAEPETATTWKVKFVAPLVTRMVGRGGNLGLRIYSASTEVEMRRT